MSNFFYLKMWALLLFAASLSIAACIVHAAEALTKDEGEFDTVTPLLVVDVGSPGGFDWVRSGVGLPGTPPTATPLQVASSSSPQRKQVWVRHEAIGIGNALAGFATTLEETLVNGRTLIVSSTILAKFCEILNCNVEHLAVKG